MEGKSKHAGHGYTKTTMEHHPDGSVTLEHIHEDGVSHKKYAVSDLDGAHDGLEDNLRVPEEKEEKLEEEIHPGIHKEVEDQAGEE